MFMKVANGSLNVKSKVEAGKAEFSRITTEDCGNTLHEN